MAYTINKTDGSILATVADGTINTDTSIVIVGKNYAGYGEFFGENFVRMLENGANTSAPGNPLTGQLWFDTAAGVLKVYNGAIFKNLGSASTDTTEPTNAVIGDLWFDPVNSQLKAYDGASWILVGPSFTAGTGTTGAIADTVQDTLAVDHIVVKLYVEDEIVGIISKDAEFTPGTAIPGFPTVKPGIQLATTVAGGTPRFEGTAANADLLDSLDSTQFLRSDQNDITSGTIAIQNSGGLYVGPNDEVQVSLVNTDSDLRINNSVNNGDMIFRVNDGGVSKDVITIDGASGRALVNAAPSTDFGIANKKYVDDEITTAVGGGLSGVLLADGSVDVAGNLLPDANNTRNLGSTTRKYANIWATTFNGVSTSAQYADLAERFEADTELMPGTVVELGGEAEITTANYELSDNVFGVISSHAAYLMNAGAGDDTTHPAVAMNGRVPVRVVGEVRKGDRLVSAGNGIARSAELDEITPFNVIGRALEDKFTAGEGVVEAIVRVSN